ncbi:chemotaxis protein CheY [Asticcacaulis sp. AC460]|uniref:response regulator n=1 Tax=Asticcacaulis sp. AC460 TaxID=1282360 RepID=UPI0003C3B889|nr:response regulator [Asticcacaulis sp. AC460]ESQ93306.1 chemotaxis protein CheY [Asticcacaulis sp. AC460]
MTFWKKAAAERQFRSDLGISLGLALIAVFFVVSGLVSYASLSNLNRNITQVTATHDTIQALNNTLSLLKDAETGERGFVLTGDPSYLEPYNSAIPALEQQVITLERQVANHPELKDRMDLLRARIDVRLAELAQVIGEYQRQGEEAAVLTIKTNRGKASMDSIRTLIADMQAEARREREERIGERQQAYITTVVSVVISSIIGVILSIAITWLISRTAAARRRNDWLQTGQASLSAALLGEQRVDQLAKNALANLAKYTEAHAGAFYAADGSTYKRVATYGVPVDDDVPASFSRGQSLLGQAVAEGSIMVVNDIADSHLTAGAALGQWRPRHVVILPAKSDGMIEAVVELGFLHAYPPATTELLERASEVISVAVRSANYRASLQNFLEETQRQSEELQSQSEELRVNNEELEEQSRALKESHVRLEQQQAELEQTNTQLEEQAAQLEAQRDDLSRAKDEVDQKARELEQSSRYKSDFLANMSHELRTPLNSSLILAKLLSDNSEGNLSEEQVEFARTIQSSGNDLLALINDILDLSKIEAGQMEIHPESVSLKRLASDMERVFTPIANQKGLKMTARLGEGVPETVTTDRQRLEQVLKNLLSNACKFTENGTVELAILKESDGIVFAVKDTGIGISAEHQHQVFDAFRQADGTISRKYGGTGLGLSISRELSRLLGGKLSVISQLGRGSTFSLSLPLAYDLGHVENHIDTRVAPAPQPAVLPQPVVDLATAIKPRPGVQDDRDKITTGARSILVVEDDPAFARILYDLAHDLDFLCLVAHTAEDAMATARQYTPSAIVLDVGLPDHSGLSVLDRLKRDVRTRHIPVHVVSAGDYAHTALSLGAVGYMLKPVKREELVDAFKGLEARLDQQMRHVLIVEDDEVQRKAMCKLLQSQDVECVAVGTAAECLEKLKEQTFDCMVLDLSLPDASGYSLLETLSQEEAYAFPPVIVYTGRDISYDDEQRLRRYSRSIIIKGAKSPERLLDEVTLFLHQVVSELSPEQQKLLKKAKHRDAMLEGRRILLVEDDVRNVYAVTNIFEPLGAVMSIARNGREALEVLEGVQGDPSQAIDLVLMDVMMPEMDGLTATKKIREKKDWKKLPVIMLTAKAMKDDQERCIEAGANDYMAKPLDVDKLVSLVRVWMPK